MTEGNLKKVQECITTLRDLYNEERSLGADKNDYRYVSLNNITDKLEKWLVINKKSTKHFQ